MTHILRQPISAIVVLLSLLSLTQAQTPSTAGDVFANARQLYAQEGASKALPEFEKALALFQKDGNRKSEAITIGLIGNCYKKLGQNQKALEFLQRALTMKQELGDKSEQGRTLSHLGLFYWETGDYTKALENYNNARTIANQIGDRNLEAAIYNNIGLVYDETGDPRALEQYNRAMDIYRDRLRFGGEEPPRASTCTLLEMVQMMESSLGEIAKWRPQLAADTMMRAMLRNSS